MSAKTPPPVYPPNYATHHQFPPPQTVHTSDGRDTSTYRFPSMAQNDESTGLSSGELQHSDLQESEPRGREHATSSFVDSAVDLESETSKGQTQGHRPNTLPKHRIRNSTTRNNPKRLSGPAETDATTRTSSVICTRSLHRRPPWTSLGQIYWSDSVGSGV